MRAFWAIQLPRSIVDRITEVIRRFKEIQERSINYVLPSNIHLTLKFLGEIDQDQINQLFQDTEKLHWESPRLKVCEVGAFPHLYKPKVLWIGIKQNSQLTRLFTEIEEICEKNGFPRETREFRPHLTIARIKGKVKHDWIDLAKDLRQEDFGEFSPDCFHLIRSELTPKGPNYSVVKTFFTGG